MGWGLGIRRPTSGWGGVGCVGGVGGLDFFWNFDGNTKIFDEQGPRFVLCLFPVLGLDWMGTQTGFFVLIGRSESIPSFPGFGFKLPGACVERIMNCEL